MNEEEKQAGLQPGDLILNKYMPNASHEEHEAARANLKAYVVFCMKLARERVKEEEETEKAKSSESSRDNRPRQLELF